MQKERTSECGESDEETPAASGDAAGGGETGEGGGGAAIAAKKKKKKKKRGTGGETKGLGFVPAQDNSSLRLLGSWPEIRPSPQTTPPTKTMQQLFPEGEFPKGAWHWDLGLGALVCVAARVWASWLRT